MAEPDFTNYSGATVADAYDAAGRRHHELMADRALVFALARPGGGFEWLSDLSDAALCRLLVLHRLRMWIPNNTLAANASAIAAAQGSPVNRAHLRADVMGSFPAPAQWSDTPDGRRFLAPIPGGTSTADRFAQAGYTLVDFSAHADFHPAAMVDFLNEHHEPADEDRRASPEVQFVISGWDMGPFGNPVPVLGHPTVLTAQPTAATVTVLVMDTGLVDPSACAHPALGGVQKLDAVVNAGPMLVNVYDDVDPVYDSQTAPNRTDWPIGSQAVHGSFIAGLVRSRTARPRILVSRACGPNRHLVADWEVIHDLERALTALTPSHGTHHVVVNMSFACPEFTMAATFETQLTSILDHHPNAVIVAAAGNRACDGNFYPAAVAHEQVVSVGSLRPDGTTCSAFSNHGGWVTCWERGEDIEGPFVDGTLALGGGRTATWTDPQPWARWSGTSFAAPIVAAKVADALAAGAANVKAAIDAVVPPAGGNHPAHEPGTGLVPERGVIVA